MKRILLIGGTGAVGQALYNVFDREKYEVTSCGSGDIDVTLPPEQWTISDGFDVVVNLAAYFDNNLVSCYRAYTKYVVDVNCTGAIHTLAKFISPMGSRGYGRIIFMSSVFADINVRHSGVYSASKAFVDKLVQVAALESASLGVTVNSIRLGYTGLGMGDGLDEEMYERSKNKSALKRFCTPEEIYQTIDFIVDTEYINVANISLDGGI